MPPTSQLAREIDGVETEVLIQFFADRVLVLVTQIGKVGNLIQATVPAATPFIPPLPDDSYQELFALPVPPASIHLTPLLGSAPSQHLATLHSLYVSQIATIIWTQSAQMSPSAGNGDQRGVIVGLALKAASKMEDEAGKLSDSERNTFIGVMRMVTNMLRGVYN